MIFPKFAEMMKHRLTKTLCLLCAALVCSAMQAADVVWHDAHRKVSYAIGSDCDAVVKVAMGMFSDDLRMVTGTTPQAATYNEATIRIVQWDKCNNKMKRLLRTVGLPTDTLATLTDGFVMQERQGHIYIIGRNGRGTAYGLLQLSRMAGVSPWVWWGDVVPVRRQSLTIPQHFSTIQGASVEWRGIFLNDEDWSTRPWSVLNHDPREQGVIGTKTYRRIFELLLRLRANTIWPAMHEGTRAFFCTPGAKEMADSCGIAIGTSHCEPLLRNNVEEWDVKKRGPFNYITNRKRVTDYWTERLQQVKASAGGNLFTIGMRGIHDGSMEGVKTMKEKTEALQQVIDDQQRLIAQHIGRPEQQTQVFVPYKEVLEIYERGLKVPPYVTLMWCDDNYGYLTRLSDAEEQKRSGGAGVYYHLSYWGRPHDYLWLTTTQPGLVYHEMKMAYDHNARKLWIANVHDVKVAGYDLELFLDMAWDIHSVSHSTVAEHYRQWLCRQFGSEVGHAIAPAMHEFYRLCGERRPEFMGWSQTELSKATYDRGLSQVRNTAFSTTAFGGELDNYLLRYDTVCRRINEAATLLRPELRDAYFAAIRYPVECAAAHAVKMLEAQRARQMAAGGAVKSVQRYPALLYVSVARSMDAYQRIRQLTAYYNEKMSGGKWNHSMCMSPRDLPVFGAPMLPLLLSEQEMQHYLANDTLGWRTPADNNKSCGHNNIYGKETHKAALVCHEALAVDACQWTSAGKGAHAVSMLGHSMRAVSLPCNESLTYEFTTTREGEAALHTALIPTQPNDKGDLCFSVAVDDAEPVVFSLKEKFRSEGWKQNVLRGQAVKTLRLPHLSKGNHRLTIKALHPHIIVDQWMLDFRPSRSFYLFPHL